MGTQVAEHPDVAPEVLAELQSVCLGLPEAYEEKAWVGTRWRIRGQTFAHARDRPGLASGIRPSGVLRRSGDRVDLPILRRRAAALRTIGHPYFGPPWRSDEVGVLLDDEVDWQEVAELVTESYCVQAPESLARQVDRPGNGV